MSTLLLLFNHTITAEQEIQAREQLHVERIIAPPEEIRTIWDNLPPETEQLQPVLAPVLNWLDQAATAGDYILVQGDFGACYLVVRYCFEQGYVPLYATTKRKAVEHHLDNNQVELTHTFEHVIFRKYGK